MNLPLSLVELSLADVDEEVVPVEALGSLLGVQLVLYLLRGEQRLVGIHQSLVHVSGVHQI